MKYNIKLQGKQAEAQNQRNQRDLSTELIDLSDSTQQVTVMNCKAQTIS